MNAIAINPPNHLRQNDGGVAADYHARDKTLATREDIAGLRAEFRAEMAEQRKENRHTQCLILGGFIGGFGAIITGIVALIAKLYLGS